MNFPVEIGIGEFGISAHLFFETLAFVVGFQYFQRLRKETVDSISTSDRIWILIGAAAGAFLFSRLIGGLESPELFFDSRQSLLYYYLNKTIVGGLLGGLIGVEITKKIIGVTQSSGDLLTYPLILGIVIGRIGCFSAGVYEQTYGVVSTLPWALDLGDGLKRHPVALYEIVFLGLLWLSLKSFENQKQLIDGMRFQLFMIVYLLFRLALDFIKPGFKFDFGLSTIQIVCVLGLLYYSKTLFLIVFHPSQLRKPHERLQ